MDHQYIEEQQIAARYLMGRLDPQECALFEEHYLDCQKCLDELELAESFQSGLKQTVAEDSIKATLAVRVGIMARLAQLARSPAALTLFVLVLTLGASSALLYQRLGSARALSQELTQQLAQAHAPQGNTVTLPLGVLRSAAAQPTVRYTLSGEPRWLLLSLEIERSESERFRVRMFDQGGEVIWSAEDLMPSQLDTLAVSVHSSWLSPGVYELEAEGFSSQSEWVGVGRFSFLATR